MKETHICVKYYNCEGSVFLVGDEISVSDVKLENNNYTLFIDLYGDVNSIPINIFSDHFELI
jgi:hypothetical protein